MEDKQTNWESQSHSVDINDVTEVRAQIAATARRMLSGDTSYIEGARVVCHLLHHARVDRFSAPFIVFVGVDSETDDVPIGPIRERWHSEAKLKFGPKWADSERYAKTYLEPACRNVIEWFAEHPC